MVRVQAGSLVVEVNRVYRLEIEEINRSPTIHFEIMSQKGLLQNGIDPVNHTDLNNFYPKGIPVWHSSG